MAICIRCDGYGVKTKNKLTIIGFDNTIFPELICPRCLGSGLEPDDTVVESRAPSAQNKGECFIASAVYGEESLKVAALRRFRDKTLSKSAAGRYFVGVYYRIAPGIAPYVRSHRRTKGVLKYLLDKIVQMIG